MMSIFSAIGGAVGSLLGQRSAESAGNKNRDMQKEFAQKGIRWRVRDAKAAGIHPLAALGAQIPSASPVYVGGGDYGLGEAGQNIDRAIAAGSTTEEKGDRLGDFIAQKVQAQDVRDRLARHEAREDLKLASQLKNDEVQRQWYWAQIMNAGREVGKPGFPGGAGPADGIQGSLPRNGVKIVPRETTARQPGQPDRTVASEPFWQLVETAPGVNRWHPAKQLDSELINAALGLQAFTDKWVSDTFFGGSPKYIQERAPLKGSKAYGRRQGGAYKWGR